MYRFTFILVALIIGAILPLQAIINSRLSRTVNGPVMAAFVSFAVGAVALFIYLLVTRQLGFGQMALQQNPWWIWIGGLIGTFYVAGIIVLLPKLGVALSFSLVVAGQMAAAIIFDHFGFLGTTVREISLGKILGALLLIAAVFLIRKF